MDRFIRELEVGEIHQRDQFQFELKSDYFPLPNQGKNIYTQEFYLFIPNSLQINQETYTQDHFYRDQTSLIRYKTPTFTLKELYDPSNKLSPLMRLKTIQQLPLDKKNIKRASEELKLLGNAIRSALREDVYLLINRLLKNEEILPQLEKMCSELILFRSTFLSIQKKWLSEWKKEDFRKQLLYVDEFISNSIHYYLIGLLEKLRESASPDREKSDSFICSLLVQEGQHRKNLQESPLSNKDTIRNEFILYRSNLLNKFIINALFLNTFRSSFDKRFRNLIGSLSAAIAMLFFLILFAWQGKVLLLDSLSFILITVILYVLKDRVKEGLKILSYQKFSKWFYDYNTDIRSLDDRVNVGKLKELVSFIQEKKLPEKIKHIRNRGFHAILEAFRRPEQIIYYKRKLILFTNPRPADPRKNALSILFRFNIEDFLRKADDPFHDYLTLNLENFQLSRTMLPKVYHLNIIMRATFTEEDGIQKEELKKFRLILDRNGIKRVEHLK